MAATSGAFSAQGGYNQSGGGYYLIMSTISPANLFSITTAASGSGGAVVPPVLGTYSAWATDGAASTFLSSGNVLKDMGKTIVLANGRAYRKFQAVGSYGTTNGVVGSAGTALTTGYLTGYLEVPSGGGQTATLTNLIARMS